MENSKIYYGGTFLESEDLKESNINHRIELEYYATKNYINEETKEKTTYGVQIIKKEYKKHKVDVESSNIEYIGNNSNKVAEIINMLKKYKVTPIGLTDVLEDLLN